MPPTAVCGAESATTKATKSTKKARHYRFYLFFVSFVHFVVYLLFSRQPQDTLQAKSRSPRSWLAAKAIAAQNGLSYNRRLSRMQ